MKKEFNNLFRTVGLLIFMFLYQAVFITILNINVDKLSDTNRIILTFVFSAIYLSLIIFIYRKTLIKDFKEFKSNLGEMSETALKYWLVGFIIMIVSNLIITMFKVGLANNEQEVRSSIDAAPIYMIFATSIFAPFVEELIFRKGFKDIFSNKYLFIIMSGLTFGSLHVVSSLESVTDFVHLIPYTALGISFAALYYKSKNIFSSITMHALHNSIAVAIYLIGSIQ